MHSLQKQFHDFVEKQELLVEGDKVLLAVSGGIDSMVLGTLFKQMSWNFAIAHCNFQLRGDESDSDELFVEKWGSQNGAVVYTKKFDLGEGSTQLNARNARYTWFNELCEEYGYTKIATAHQLNDSLETVILNLVRGTGMKGIAGIPPISDKVIRPLLFASRDEIIDFAQQEVIKWREDSSNKDSKYRRNFIRNEVIPKLQELNPSLIRTFGTTTERLQHAQTWVMAEAERIKARHLTSDGGIWKLDLSWMAHTKDQMILDLILDEYGFNYATIRDLKESLGKVGKSFYSERWELTTDRGVLYVKPRTNAKDATFLVEGEGWYSIDGKKLIVTKHRSEELEISGEKWKAYLDAKKVKFPLEVRGWVEGDTFRPLGMEGTKKVSDFLVDEKIPLALKDGIKVVISHGEIVWLMGHRISDLYKVEEATKEIFEMELL